MATATLAIPPPIFSPFLDDQCGKINAKGVSWEVSRASTGDKEEVSLPVSYRAFMAGVSTGKARIR